VCEHYVTSEPLRENARVDNCRLAADCFACIVLHRSIVISLCDVVFASDFYVMLFLYFLLWLLIDFFFHFFSSPGRRFFSVEGGRFGVHTLLIFLFSFFDGGTPFCKSDDVIGIEH
jgi:hypothetical protein